MPFTRYFQEEMPPLEVIQQVGGPVIVERTVTGGVTGAETGTVALVGEFLKGTPNVPVEVTPNEFRSLLGGFNKYVGDGAARGYDGNGYVALSNLKFSRLVCVPVNDRVGSVALSRAAPGAAALTSSGTGPFNLADGDTFTVTVQGPALDATLTINAEAATNTASVAENYDFTNPADRILTLAVDGGPTQTYTILVGDVVAIGAVTAEEIRDIVNAQFTGVSATIDGAGTHPIVTSDRKGLTSSLQFGGTARPVIGFSAALVQPSLAPVDNNVNNVSAVTVNELAALLTSILTLTTATNVGGRLRITHLTPGIANTITLSGTIPGISPAGKIPFPTTIGPVTGGTGTALAATLFAGSRVSDGGGNVFMLGADAEFAEGALTPTVTPTPIKQVSGTTVGIGAITTFVDVPDPALFTSPAVTNAAVTTAIPATPAAWGVVYADALAALLVEESPMREVEIVVSARHQSLGVAAPGIMDLLTDHCIAASNVGMFRIAIVSPPIGTPKTTAQGASTVGVSATTSGGRHKRRMYVHPGFMRNLLEITADDPTLDGNVDWPADIFAASKLSQLAPELSIEQEGRDALAGALALETYFTSAGAGGALTIDDYKAARRLGICAPIMDRVLGPTFESQHMSVLPTTSPGDVNCSERRFRDWAFRTLSDYGAAKKGKLNTPSRRRAILGDVSAFLQGLVDAERIGDFRVKITTPTAMLGKGVVVFQVAVRTLDHLVNIVFDMTVGTTVNVTAVA